MDVIRRISDKLMKIKVFPMTKQDNVFHKFCSETSLPGWPYLNREMSQVWRLIWVSFLLTACATSVYALVNIHLILSYTSLANRGP